MGPVVPVAVPASVILTGMPHIHLQTSADLHENGDIPEILQKLVETLCAFETMNPAAVKAYHTLRPNWVVGEGHPEGFAHAEVAVLSGRPEALRIQIADGMFEALRECFSTGLSNGEVGVSLELREMAAATYRK